KDKDFRDALLVEQNRKENGEDISLFVKNLENVQGDERDIIIFSTAYAKNEYGKVVAHFGLLSNEGGENRLNVAITRAKQKIYLVTSIEPEELNVDASKNLGPKLFREYLKYVRAVANGNSLETKLILNNLLQTDKTSKHNLNATLQTQLKQELEALGYNVELDVGNTSSNLPLAIYDKRKDKYLLGIEFDFSAHESSDSVLERDVYRPAFLQSRGWNIYRVWSRDWWLNKKKVLNTIVKLLQK
ncbi:MAG: AAA domain-containing protein, partial [Christensenellales bacterium]